MRSCKERYVRTWEIKEIAFRKPFSKKLKEHLLSISYVEMPSEQTRSKKDTNENVDLEGLSLIFAADDENDHFLGFETIFDPSTLEAIGFEGIFRSSQP